MTPLQHFQATLHAMMNRYSEKGSSVGVRGLYAQKGLLMNLLPSEFIPQSELQCLSIVDRDVFATTWLGSWAGRQVLIKLLTPAALRGHLPIDVVTFIEGDVLNLRRLRHPNILAFMGAVYEWPNVGVVTEHVQGVTLATVLSDESFHRCDPAQVIVKLSICAQLSSAVAHCHSLNPPIVHREITPDTVLMTDKQQVKICGFIRSERKRGRYIPNAVIDSTAFAWWFSSPEELVLKQHARVTEKVDIWRLGLLFCHIFGGTPAYEKCRDEADFIEAIHSNAPSYELPASTPPPIAQIVQSCLQFDPQLRPSAEDLFQFFQKEKDEAKNRMNSASSQISATSSFSSSFMMPASQTTNLLYPSRLSAAN